jgi:hypothetical protein
MRSARVNTTTGTEAQQLSRDDTHHRAFCSMAVVGAQLRWMVPSGRKRQGRNEMRKTRTGMGKKKVLGCNPAMYHHVNFKTGQMQLLKEAHTACRCSE